MASRVSRVKVDPTSPMGLDEDEQDYVDANPYAAPELKRKSRVSGGPVRKGWGAPKEERREVVKAPYLDMKNGKLMIKILDDEPVINFKQHYVNSQRKYATCSAVREEGIRCPLCDAGHKPSQQFRMNVVDMDEPDEVKTWTFGWMVAGILQDLADDTPLTDPKWYFQVWRTKPANGGTYTYTVRPIKARDLQEDYGLEPIDAVTLENFELYGEETLWISSQKQLEDLADSLTPKDLGEK